ncbi:MAG: DNA double-strand break repair nuclease NurA, partial [Acidobacteria bacterium]|nr:DNA double-strand break repair nuclease NurA [Acidobacteriota bacterium]
MLLPERIVEQLHNKRAHFRAYDDDFQREAAAYTNALAQLAEFNTDQLNAKLNEHEAPGALATDEFNGALALPFAPTFAHHEAARAWAHDVLLNHTTMAADGSQILPAPDLSIPIAAAQVAWFVNAHTPTAQYEKNLTIEILAPDELLLSYEGETKISEQLVNLKRFELEAATLCRLMREWAENKSEHLPPLPLVFFDSSLVISFVEQVHQQTRARYLEAVRQLLRCSAETRVPVVGYVDSSHARDLTRMLAVGFEFAEAERINDAQLLNRSLDVWGMRSPYFICARGSSRGIQQSVLEQLGEEFRRELGFVYLKTNSNAPARLEIP